MMVTMMATMMVTTRMHTSAIHVIMRLVCVSAFALKSQHSLSYGAADGVQGGQPWIHIANSTGTMWLFATDNCCDPSKHHGVNVATSTDGGFNWTQVSSCALHACTPVSASTGPWRVRAATALRFSFWQSRSMDRGWRQRRAAVAHAARDHVQPERPGRALADLPVCQQRRHQMAAPEQRGASSLTAAPPRRDVRISSNTLSPSSSSSSSTSSSVSSFSALPRRYGGPRFASVNGRLQPKWQSDGLYHLWFHAVNGSGNLPTDIYHAQSRDLLMWNVTAPPALRHSGRGFEYDQVAGGVPMAVGGKAYMYYDGDNNVDGTCAIGLVTADARAGRDGTG
jgi:hypothetical protein